MSDQQSLDMVALSAMRGRITKIFPAQIRACVEELSEEQLWWRPNESSNSVGNLVIHLSGSMRHYVARGIGGVNYERNRPAEFAERNPVSKEALLANFDETIVMVSDALDSFDTSRFLDPTEESAYNPTVFNLLFNVAVHVATHTGQIVFVTKMLKEGSLDEVWIRAHKGELSAK